MRLRSLVDADADVDVDVDLYVDLDVDADADVVVCLYGGPTFNVQKRANVNVYDEPT